MNNKPSITYFILMFAPLLFSCHRPLKEENKNNTPASSLSLHIGDKKYKIIDIKESMLTWKGSSLIGSNSHTGYVYLSKGELRIENGQLVGGTVEVDMNTIEDQKHGRDNNLVNHLKDPDFFDVEKFPFSTIVITRVEPASAGHKKITGNLTIKGITHAVTFPAKMKVKDGMIKANGKLVIDRTKWDVRYKSRKFYDILANQTISDSIAFDIKMVTKK